MVEATLAEALATAMCKARRAVDEELMAVVLPIDLAVAA